jgi:hypothetical protein
VPFAQYAKLANDGKDVSGLFTTSKDAVVNWIALQAAEEAKSLAKEREEFAKKYAAKLGYVKQTAAPSAPAHPQKTPAAPAPRHTSPSVGGSSAVPPSAGTVASATPDGGDFLGNMLVTR